jgi:hypothetical protein
MSYLLGFCRWLLSLSAAIMLEYSKPSRIGAKEGKEDKWCEAKSKRGIQRDDALASQVLGDAATAREWHFRIRTWYAAYLVRTALRALSVRSDSAGTTSMKLDKSRKTHKPALNG